MSEITKVPAGAKKPQDRKPKESDVRLVTVDGHEYTVPTDGVPDDFEFLADLGSMEDGNAARMPSVLKRILGADGYKAAMNNLRDESSGVVSIERGAKFVRDLFEALDPNS